MLRSSLIATLAVTLIGFSAPAIAQSAPSAPNLKMAPASDVSKIDPSLTSSSPVSEASLGSGRLKIDPSLTSPSSVSEVGLGSGRLKIDDPKRSHVQSGGAKPLIVYDDLSKRTPAASPSPKGLFGDDLGA